MTEAATRAARALAPEVETGSILGGRYRIGPVIGAGGMGVVFAAEHLNLGEPVAIKILLPDVLAQGPDVLSRFAREAWAASKIKSEYVARVNDVGRLSNGTPYLVMEFLEGADLEGMLRMSGRLEVTQAVEFMLQACEGLAEAHALGVVHRDLKPSNLFCIRRSAGVLAIKVLDFGISKVTSTLGNLADLRVTAPSTMVGSPLYMSPEQMSSASVVDARADVWSLGVIRFELLTGERFRVAIVVAVLAAAAGGAAVLIDRPPVPPPAAAMNDEPPPSSQGPLLPLAPSAAPPAAESVRPITTAAAPREPSQPSQPPTAAAVAEVPARIPEPRPARARSLPRHNQARPTPEQSRQSELDSLGGRL